MRTDLTAMVVSCRDCGAVVSAGDATCDEVRDESFEIAWASRLSVDFMTPDNARSAMARFGACTCDGAHDAGVSSESPCGPSEEVTG
ncbi:MAG: hypothetical protein MOGMAGMI_02460 [Candidatus Omnitrophica bacterium]|nr:hypothetical protein [Candidatus Omnitrophota bacterium]